MTYTVSFPEVVAGAPYVKQYTLNLPTGGTFVSGTAEFIRNNDRSTQQAITPISDPIALTLVSGSTYEVVWPEAEMDKLTDTDDLNGVLTTGRDKVRIRFTINWRDARNNDRVTVGYSSEIQVG